MLSKYLAIAFIFICASPIFAQCRNITYYQPHSFYPTVEVKKEVVVEQVLTPVAIPVLVPAYQFQYVPAPCQQTPQVQAMPQQSLQNAVNSEEEKIKRLIREVIREELSAPQSGPPPIVEDGLASPALTYESVLKNRCYECHNAGNTKGDFLIFSGVNTLSKNLDRDKVFKEAVSFRMPPKAKQDLAHRLSPEELRILEENRKTR